MLTSITDAIRDGDIYDIEELVQNNLDSGSDPNVILDAMKEGLDQCGKKFEAGEFFLPDLLQSGKAFSEGMSILEPHLLSSITGLEGKVLLGTVAGDIHDIGKNLVGFLLKSSGFEVINLGTNKSTEGFIQAVKQYQPDVLGMSALLTTTMLGMGDVIKAMDEEGLREKTKVIVGGAPVSERFAKSIDADAYAHDAVEGIKKIKELISGNYIL